MTIVVLTFTGTYVSFATAEYHKLNDVFCRNLDAYRGADNLDKHFMQFKSSRYIQTDGILIPNGTFGSVKGTPLDFNEAKSVGGAVNATVGFDLCGTGMVYAL